MSADGSFQLKPLRDPGENGAAQAKLLRADADARAIANFIAGVI